MSGWVKKSKPLLSLFITTLSLVFLLPLPLGVASGLGLWLSPYVMISSAIALRSFVILNILGAAILLLIAFSRRRIFCHYICPTGFFCRRVSKLSHFRRSYARMPNIGKYILYFTLGASLVGMPITIFLDPLSILGSAFVPHPLQIILITALPLITLLISQIIFPYSWCSKLCPLGGMQEEICEIKVRKYQTITRGKFISAVAGSVTSLSLLKFYKPTSANLRPPAALNSPFFEMTCARCGNCVRVCPSKIIEPNTSDLFQLLTPKLNMSNGSCLSDCNLCSTVCTSGAITQFSKEAKYKIKIALAEIEPDRCLMLKGKECAHCKTNCPYGAITIDKVPTIDRHKCTGCGICAQACPESIIKLIPISNKSM
ncbi:MAG: 4Fe-4S dicluster domain-containing protein [Rikenellaceae bacterium]